MGQVKSEKRKRIFLFLRIGFVVCGIIGAIFWASKEGRWGKLTAIFSQMNLWVFAAVLVVFIFCMIIVGLRWWILLRAQSIFIPFWATVRLYFLGWFYNNFMPGAVGGDLVRAWYVTRHTEKKLEAVLTVFVDRVIGLASTMIIAVFFYSLFLRGRGLEITGKGGEGGGVLDFLAEQKVIIFWILVIIAAFFGGLMLNNKGRALLKRILSNVYVHGLHAVKKLKDAIVIYCTRPAAILVAFGLTFFLQILSITGYWFLCRSMGIDVSLKYYLVFFTLSWVFGAVPVSVGGAVVVEGMLAYMFVHFAGLAAEEALVIALCQRIVWMIASLPGGVIHLIGAHLPKDFFVDENSSVN